MEIALQDTSVDKQQLQEEAAREARNDLDASLVKAISIKSKILNGGCFCVKMRVSRRCIYCNCSGCYCLTGPDVTLPVTSGLYFVSGHYWYSWIFPQAIHNSKNVGELGCQWSEPPKRDANRCYINCVVENCEALKIISTLDHFRPPSSARLRNKRDINSFEVTQQNLCTYEVSNRVTGNRG